MILLHVCENLLCAEIGPFYSSKYGKDDAFGTLDSFLGFEIKINKE